MVLPEFDPPDLLNREVLLVSVDCLRGWESVPLVEVLYGEDLQHIFFHAFRIFKKMLSI
jgi:hypothetical protein